MEIIIKTCNDLFGILSKLFWLFVGIFYVTVVAILVLSSELKRKLFNKKD